MTTALDIKRPATIWMPPPKLSEHTDEVLREFLGHSDARIAELRGLGIIQ